MFLNICGNFERVGVPAAGGGGFLGGTPSIREKPGHAREPHQHWLPGVLVLPRPDGLILNTFASGCYIRQLFLLLPAV